jgi:glycosyltransferase involved in cell wall biosynthesis
MAEKKINFIKIIKKKSIIFLVIIIISMYKFNKKRDNLYQIQDYLKMNLNEKLINSFDIFYKVKNPKISIIISVYNGKGYIKSAVRSIQNQNFKDIEIIIIDDFSSDDSEKVIKELMKEDPRIVFLSNKENKGALYTKTKGILQSKGKYVMTLDMDDLYASEDAFSTLYDEAEKYDLDIVGFGSIINHINILKKNIIKYNYFESPIILQPDISKRMYIKNENGEIKRLNNVIWCFFYKRKLFIKAIKLIENKFLNRIMNVHDDMILFFLLTRNARKLKQIQRIFHIVLIRPNPVDPSIIYRLKEKDKERKKNNCLAYLSYAEFLFLHTNNTYNDKEIASYELELWFLDNECRNNTLIRKHALNICLLYLKNRYINNRTKEKIKTFIKECRG